MSIAPTRLERSLFSIRTTNISGNTSGNTIGLSSGTSSGTINSINSGNITSGANSTGGFLTGQTLYLTRKVSYSGEGWKCNRMNKGMASYCSYCRYCGHSTHYLGATMFDWKTHMGPRRYCVVWCSD